MEWKVDASVSLKKDHIAVPESGGVYTLFCINYATFGCRLCLRTVCKLKRTVVLEV